MAPVHEVPAPPAAWAPAPATSKLPAITLGFWALKMAATTLGETGGDQISEAMHVGFLTTFVIFMAVFLAAVVAQVRAGRLVPALFWTVIVATSAAGTEMADFIFKTVGIGVVSGAMALVAPIVLIVALGRITGGSFSVTDITSRRDEVLYWATILTTNTIGTGLGDGLTAGLGVVGGTLVASSMMGVVIWAYFRTSISRVVLFWAAFITTRPLGATGGDLLWQPHSAGGLGLGRIAVSIALALFMVVLIAKASRDTARSTT
ncbi:MAG: hypothetical protein H7287_04305 [Thermoleophilia bacterium]|nr:hypothetical protein [Thermoleophilia bacterium]